MVDLKNMDSHGFKMIARFRKAFLLQSTRLGKIRLKIRVLVSSGEFFLKSISDIALRWSPVLFSEGLPNRIDSFELIYVYGTRNRVEFSVHME